MRMGYWSGSRGKAQVGGLAALLLLLAAGGCGQNCGESLRLGDFERGQGNLENALRHYERALAADEACPGAAERAEEVRARLKRQREQTGAVQPSRE